MSRIVVVLENAVNGPPQLFLAEPSRNPEASKRCPVDMTKARDVLQKMKTQAGNGDGIIREAGVDLLNMLADHPVIRSDVLPSLDIKYHRDKPIYLFIKDRNPDLELLPWEALHAPNVGFLSANKHFPVARAQKVDAQKSIWTFTPPLKVMAIMGAGGSNQLSPVSAEEEWQNLYDALKRSGTKIKLRVLLCEKDLKERIDKEGRDWISTDLLHDRDQLFRDIREFGPQILHFFCHGDATSIPRLHVASWRNWDAEMPGNIWIEGPQLKQRADPSGNVWLVTLNCCESARSAEESNSVSMPMTCSLVYSGFPAVVGMREQIDEDFAHDFCGLFYDALLDDFTSRVNAARKKTSVAEVHWACALFAARQRICEMIDSESIFSDVAGSVKDWTIPVIYTRLEKFRLRLIPTEESAGNSVLPSAYSLEPSLPRQASSRSSSGLTGKQIRQLAEEMSQLIEDRKAFKSLKLVVNRIDTRLAEIEVLLKS